MGNIPSRFAYLIADDYRAVLETRQGNCLYYCAMTLRDVNDRPNGCHCSLELVWDEDLDATAVTEQGAPIKVGPAASLSPAHLLGLAASSCLMTTLLTLAREAGVSVEGYVSSARLRQTPGAIPDVALAVCVVVGSDADRQQIEQLWPQAVERSPTVRLLSAHLQVEPTVRLVSAE
jgi:organic hydroperoxide reductase OsmC/OhrA